ncbi:MAG: hypothetical protein ITD48_06485 [Nitrospira sp.]|jgi:hypothetical protein|nr:hypothetical protein [Nitrospira sp.]GBL38873.1 hypothetical protein EMGBD2_01310 [Nitrospirota bacterium]GDX89925.1 hypothetical protein LBMAG45_17810 [Nitrospirota bacterium]
MEILALVKRWTGALADTAVSVIALLIVLEVLFKGAVIPFLPNPGVIGSVTGIVKALGAEGLVGLVAVWILYSIWEKK